MQITYRIDPSCNLIAADMGITPDQFAAYIDEGMKWFTVFWRNTVSRSARGRFVFRVSRPTKAALTTAWAWYKANTVHLNRAPISSSTGNVLQWSPGGLVFVGPHEVGHGLITTRHITKPPYYGDPSYGHVMAVTSYAFQNMFSPYEVWLRRSWGIRAGALHPFARDWQSFTPNQQSATRPVLMKIVKPYYQLGYHGLLGVADVDDELKALPRLKTPVIV